MQGRPQGAREIARLRCLLECEAKQLKPDAASARKTVLLFQRVTGVYTPYTSYALFQTAACRDAAFVGAFLDLLKEQGKHLNAWLGQGGNLAYHMQHSGASASVMQAFAERGLVPARLGSLKPCCC